MQYEDEVLLQKFGNHLKDLRKKKFGSLNNFALNHSLVSSATVSRVENAKNDFKFTTFIKLANAMDISPAKLLENFEFKYSE